MTIPGWVEFWGMVSMSSGLIALLLVDLLITIAPESWLPEIERTKRYIALIATIIVPLLVSRLLDAIPTVDPVWWQIAFIVGSYAVHEWLFRFIQKPLVERFLR